MGAVFLIGAGLFGCQKAGLSLCLFHRWTGLPCLTCGSTRAFMLLLSGDVVGAFVQQPLATAVFFAVVSGLTGYTFNLFVLRRHIALRLTRRERVRAIVATVGLILLNWAYLVWHGV